ncbi:MAG: TetR/AcrR family transcriptional regulator [Acidimicrobiales bacterium]
MTTTYHHGNLRQALLDAVGEIVAEKGTGGVSLREAARRAGVSHGAPAHHFGDKLGLLTAFSARGFELFGTKMRAAADGAETPEEKIVAVGLEYLRFAIEERAYFEVMFRDDMHDRTDSHHDAVSKGAFSVVMEIADQLAKSGSGRGDPMIIAIRAWSNVHGLATLWLDGALGHFWQEDDIYGLARQIFDAQIN